MSNRRKIRETVMQAIYAFSVGEQSLEHVLQTIIVPSFREDPAGLEFAEKLFLRTADNLEKTEEIIQDHIANWEIERLAVVDRIILQMAISEIVAFHDIPAKVTINEAIEIAKKYSTSRSGRFVNGILDAVFLTLKEKGGLQKKGRGLIDQPARKKRKTPTEPSFHAGTDNETLNMDDMGSPSGPSRTTDGLNSTGELDSTGGSDSNGGLNSTGELDSTDGSDSNGGSDSADGSEKKPLRKRRIKRSGKKRDD